jgi:hypothetical protein
MAYSKKEAVELVAHAKGVIKSTGSEPSGRNEFEDQKDGLIRTLKLINVSLYSTWAVDSDEMSDIRDILNSVKTEVEGALDLKIK